MLAIGSRVVQTGWVQGKSDSKRELLDAAALCRQLVATGSVEAFLADHRGELFPAVVVRERCTIGQRVIIHAGSVLGSDGFGYRWDGTKHAKIPHVGTVIVEVVFSWPGLGTLLYQAISVRDIPLTTGIVVTYTTLFIAINVAIDIVYFLIDPRIRASQAG